MISYLGAEHVFQCHVVQDSGLNLYPPKKIIHECLTFCLLYEVSIMYNKFKDFLSTSPGLSKCLC